MISLLDVNALIALFDSAHVHHEAMHRWFGAHASAGWATCPLTENGFVRIISQPVYASGRRKPADLIVALRQLKSSHSRSHEFWPDAVSLTDTKLFKDKYVVSSRHITDIYLLGLAARHRGRLVSFDRNLPWQAVQGGTSSLIETPV